MRLKNAVLRAFTIMSIFFIIAITVVMYKNNLWYLALFGGIGIISGLTEFLIGIKPEKSQLIRRTVLLSLSATLVTLALLIGLNFQFSQVCFDLYSGIITGAFIQFTVARLIIPLFFGNIFCSRACWDSAFFEIADRNKNGNPGYPLYTAWIFLFIIIFITFAVSHFFLPQAGTDTMRILFIAENIMILITGLVFSYFTGKRAYCRYLCPFIAVSGTVSRFSLFKITPVQQDACTGCGKCTKACPMGIDVREYVKKGQRINHPRCIVCEQCVHVCREKCLALST